MEFQVKHPGLPELSVKVLKSLSHLFEVDLSGLKISPKNHEDLIIVLKEGEIPQIVTSDLGREFSFNMNEDFTFVFWADAETKCRLVYEKILSSVLIKRY